MNPSSEWTNEAVEVTIVDGKTGTSGKKGRKNKRHCGRNGCWSMIKKTETEFIGQNPKMSKIVGFKYSNFKR